MNHKALSVQQCRAGHFCAPTLRSGKKNQENHYVVCTYYIILLLQIAHLCSVIKNKNDMEIVTMDHEVVKAMMSKIDRIAAYVFKKENVPKEEPEILLTSEETADLLKISTRTLQRMRKDRTILCDDAEQMPLPPRGSGGMCTDKNREMQPADTGRVQTELSVERKGWRTGI